MSLTGRDHRPAAWFDAVNSFMVARNAGTSFIGRVIAFCSEKSCRRRFASGTALPSRVRSTENDNDRTSGLKSEFMFGSAFANRTTAGYARLCKNAFREPRRLHRIAFEGNVKNFEPG